MAVDSSRNPRRPKKSRRKDAKYKRVKEFLDGLTFEETRFAAYEVIRKLTEMQPTQPFSLSHPDDPIDFVGVVTPPAVLDNMPVELPPATDPPLEFDETDPRPEYEQLIEKLEAEFYAR